MAPHSKRGILKLDVMTTQEVMVIMGSQEQHYPRAGEGAEVATPVVCKRDASEVQWRFKKKLCQYHISQQTYQRLIATLTSVVLLAVAVLSELPSSERSAAASSRGEGWKWGSPRVH